MEAEDGVVASSGFPITPDGRADHFGVSLPRHQPATDARSTRQLDGPTMVPSPYPTQQDGPASSSAEITRPPELPSTTQVANVGASEATKKRRGRPRKYGPDGSVIALSPMPISASIPLGEEAGTWAESVKKKHKKTGFGSPGGKIAYLAGANFTPHVLKVNPGEDVTMKIVSFSQQSARAVCVLSANGTVSNATFRRPTSLGGTLTYEGRFEILSLSGSYAPVESGGSASRSGGMSVSLAGPDGRVVGGGLAGLLVAAGPVQVVLGSFLPGHQQEQKPKKQRVHIPASMPPVITNISARDETRGFHGGDKPPVISPAPPLKGEASVPFSDNRNTTEGQASFRIDELNGLVS